MKPISLYLHIPFCKKKCKYCDFISFEGCENQIEDYLVALKMEIRNYQNVLKGYWVKTIFIGGGTPSLLSCNQIEGLMDALRECFTFTQDYECTIESNPESLSIEKAKAYLKNGINRISMGVQASEQTSLKQLGRIHTFDEFLQKYHMLREIGFENINVDLMFGLPNQTIAEWMITLEQILILQPEHISAYGLILEPGTKLEAEYEASLCELPNEELEREFFWLTHEILRKHGYQHYEISNFTKANYGCRHNCVYWTCDEYIGVGISASSYFHGMRYTNTSHLEEYIAANGQLESIHPCRELITRQKAIEEYLFLGLRLLEGVSITRFEAKFSQTLESIYQEILQQLQKDELIAKIGDFIQLTPKGIDLSNYVLAHFLLEDLD